MRPEPGYPELFWTLLLVRWRLRRRGFHALASAALVAPATVAWPAAAKTLRRLQRLTRLTGGACLIRALALLQVAQRRGLQGQLVIGAQREGGRLHAHAWVRFGSVCHGQTQRAGQAYQAFPAPAQAHAGRPDSSRAADIVAGRQP